MELSDRHGRGDYDAYYEELGEERFLNWWAWHQLRPRGDRLIEWLASKAAAISGLEDAEKLFWPMGFPEVTEVKKPDRYQTKEEALAVIRRYRRGK